MTQTALPNLGINYDWEAGEDGWKNGMDLNMLIADAFLSRTVVAQLDADPWASTSSPTPGKMYIIGETPTGATAPWDTASAATIANKLAIATGNNAGVTRWHLITPKDGWTFFNQSTGQYMTFRGTHGSGGLWYSGAAGLPNHNPYSVISMAVDTPPGSPTERDAYIVPAGASGDWSGTHENDYTWWDGVAWRFIEPLEGMRIRLATTGEYYYFDGSAWVADLKYLAANSRSYKIVNAGNDGVGPFDTDRAAPTYTLTREEASAQALIIFNASMLGALTFDNTASGAIVGDGTIGNVGFSEGAPEETWTLVCTAGGATATFSVTGSISGAMADATVGTPYDNGVVAFELTTGGTNFSSTGDADRITFTSEEMPISYSADDTDVIAAMVGVVLGFCVGPRFKFEAGGATLTMYGTDGSDLIQADPSAPLCGSIGAGSYSHRVSSSKVNKVVSDKTANYTLKPGDEGALIVMDTTSGGLTLTIPDSPAVQMLNGASLKVFHKGANTLTISGAAGVTLVGTTAGTQNTILHLERSGTSDTWYCG